MRCFCLAGAALALLIAAAPASASTARVDGSTVAFEGGPGEANDVTVAYNAGTWTITDNGAALVAGSGCSGAGTVTCTGASAADIGGGDGNDRITVGPTTLPVNLHGDAGADVIHSDASNATLDYSTARSGVNVIIDNQALDGEQQERDLDTGTFARIVGSPYDDEINSATNSTTLVGGGGTDILIGNMGNDTFVPGPGNDSVYGGGGDDTALLEGTNGAGFYSGGPGRDSLTVDQQGAPLFDIFADGDADDGIPGAGHVNVQADWESMTVPSGTVVGGSIDDDITVVHGTANGGRGNDRVAGDETLIGGRGRDAFVLNNPATNVVKAVDGEVDRIDCSRGVPKSIAIDPIDKAPGCGPAFKLSGSKTVRVRHGAVSLKLACASPAGSGPCRSKVTLGSGKTVYARTTTTSVAPGETVRVRLKLTARYRGRKLRGQLTVTPAGSAKTLPSALGRIVIRP